MESKSYEASPYYTIKGNVIPWATRVLNPRVNKRKSELIQQRPNQTKELNSAALIACDIAAGKLIGDYFVDEDKLNGTSVIPIVYPPDSALPIAEGMQTSLDQHIIPNRVYAAFGEPEGDDPTKWEKSSYRIPEEAIDLARESGVLIICEGIISRGATLVSCLNSIPSDYNGKVLIAAGCELTSSSAIANNHATPTPLMEYIRTTNSEESKKAFKIELCVSDRQPELQSDLIPDVGNMVKAIHKPDRTDGVHALGKNLVKRTPPDSPNR